MDWRPQSKPIAAVEEAEAAARELRKEWDLGHGPVGDLTALLEERQIHVLLLDAPATFDGLPALGTDSQGQLCLAAIALRQGLPGGRQRLSAAHELGHLMLMPEKKVNEEKAAHRFAAAFLAPAESVRNDTGERRARVSLPELEMLKHKYGMSMAAVLYRLADLGIITPSYLKEWFMDFSRCGWRKQEPSPLPAEEPRWLERTVWHALGEGLIDEAQAQKFLGKAMPSAKAAPEHWRGIFAKAPLAVRREWLRHEAERLKEHYETDAETREWMEADL